MKYNLHEIDASKKIEIVISSNFLKIFSALLWFTIWLGLRIRVLIEMNANINYQSKILIQKKRFTLHFSVKVKFFTEFSPSKHG